MSFTRSIVRALTATTTTTTTITPRTSTPSFSQLSRTSHNTARTMSTMKSFIVRDWAAGPSLEDVPAPEAPTDPGHVQVKVLAAGIHQVVRSRASGAHFLSGQLPQTVGVDGTGIETRSGKPVYFSSLAAAPHIPGSVVESVNLPKFAIAPLPEGVDPVVAAALVNPVLSSWMALAGRVDWLRPNGRGGVAENDREGEGWTAMIMGVTSASGKLAVRVARSMGAAKVYGAARNEEEMAKIEGLDGYTVLKEDAPMATQFSPEALGADVVLDYLYGPWPKAFIVAGAKAKVMTPITWICIGDIAGADGGIPGMLLRGRAITLRGAGPGSWSRKEALPQTPKMLAVLKGLTPAEVGIETVKMADVKGAWENKGKGRTVVTMGE